MIVIGYQGIGKSTLEKKSNKYIDLESSNFKYGNPPTKDENWYKPYCYIAYDLSQKGYIVFTSSHKEVRDYFMDMGCKECVIAIAPSVNLKEQWISRLVDRYAETQLDKDKYALLNARDRYVENTREIIYSGFKSYEITSIPYDLEEIINLCSSWWRD